MAIDLPDIRGRIRIDTSDIDRAQRKLSELNRTFASFGGDAEKGFGRADKAQRDFAKGSDESAKANKRNSDSLFEVVKAGALMAGAMKAIKFPAMIAGANLAAQGISALAAGAVAFVAAIAPASGAIAALPGVLAAAGLAMGTVKLASMGLSDELKRLGEDDAFTPKAVTKFAEFLDGLRPKLNALRETAAKELFPNVQRGIEAMLPLFPILQKGIGDTAGTLGRLAFTAGNTIAKWGPDLQEVFKRSQTIIGDLGMASIHAASGLKDITLAAMPLAQELSSMVRTGAEWLANVIATNRANGDLGRFFERTRGVLVQLGHILRDFGVALFNVFSGGTELGNDMLTGLERLAKKFREWTESFRGENAIKDWFAAAKAPLQEFWGLIGDIGEAFLRLNKDSKLDLADTISQVRDKIVPALEKLLETTGKLFTEKLIDLAAKFIDTLTKFGSETGALTTFIDALGKMLDVVNALANIPGFTEFVATMGILRGTMAAFKFAGFITGASQLGPLILTMSTRLGGLMTALRGVSLMLLTPPLGIVVALGALVAALIYAYNESETFRRFVDEAFAAVKVAVATAVDVVIGWLQKMSAFWFEVADQVLTNAELMFSWIPGVGDKIATARSHFDSFRANVETNLERAKTASEGWKNKTIGDFIAIGNKVTELPQVKSIEITAIDNASETIRGIVAAIASIPTTKTTRHSIITDSGELGARYRHSGGPVYHSGGHVQAFHGGGLKGNEVGAKLLVGEFVLNRATTRALGAAGLAQLNASGGRAGMGGNTYNITIQGNWDFTNPNVEYAIGEKMVKAIKRVEGTFD